MKRKLSLKELVATFALTLALIGSAPAVEYVVTKSDGVVTTGYPLEPRADDMVELLNVSIFNGSMQTRLTFSDGGTLTETARSFLGAKILGVTEILPSEAKAHALLWKITPRSEYAKDGATYVFLRQGVNIDVPPDSLVTLISHRLDATSGGAKFEFADPALDNGFHAGDKIGAQMPMVTRISTTTNAYPIFEITSATAPALALAVATVNGISGTNFVMRWDSVASACYQIQCSSDLTGWADIGVPISGTGAPMSWSAAAVDADGKFYRVVSKT